MRISRFAWPALLVVGMTAAVGCSDDKPAEPVTVTKLNYEEFDKAVKGHQGKVVLIDVWFRGCAPCVKKFPHLVEMHKKYGPKGLICVTLDPVDTDPKDKAKVEKFLTEKGAAFPNYIVDDSEENWKKWNPKYPTNVTPTVILFNRKGERVAVIEEPEDEKVEKEVEKLLAEK
jgi:thiol-disulfide isomerase/thioredoxin